jgi:4Fe-4S ferredoxin
MKPNRWKRTTHKEIEIGFRMYRDQVTLVIDTEACIHGSICETVCPEDAIYVYRDGEQLRIDIREDLCSFCEACVHFCPVPCIEIKWGGQMKQLLSQQRALLPFPEKLTINTDICPEKCRDNAKGSVRWCRKERKTIENPSLECPKHCTECVDHCHREALGKEDEKTQLKDEYLCLRCAYCEAACPHGAMEVHPVYQGTIRLDDSKCPEGCNLCIDVCPVEAIHRDGVHVFIEDTYCILCGACAKICDRNAIEIRREQIAAIGEEAAALWNTCVENLKKVMTSEG